MIQQPTPSPAPSLDRMGKKVTFGRESVLLFEKAERTPRSYSAPNNRQPYPMGEAVMYDAALDKQLPVRLSSPSFAVPNTVPPRESKRSLSLLEVSSSSSKAKYRHASLYTVHCIGHLCC